MSEAERSQWAWWERAERLAADLDSCFYRITAPTTTVEPTAPADVQPDVVVQPEPPRAP